jgi:hypothetical protein
MPLAPGDSSNVVPFRAPVAGDASRIAFAGTDAQLLVELLTALNGQSLQSAFAAMDLLQIALDQVEAAHAVLPDHPGIPKLREETSRLSCELFSARMMAVRLSSTLAHLRQSLATSQDDRTADPAGALRLIAPGS